MSSATIGKLLAAVVFTGLVGLVLYGLSQSAPSGPERVEPLQPGPTPQTRRTDGVLGQVESSLFQSFDPETGQLRYEFEWEILDPVGQGRYEVKSPVATFYQPGRTVEVRAEEGRLLWPTRDAEPESGSLSGDVVITVRDAGDSDRVIGRMSTASLFFQSVLGEINAPERVEIRAPGVEFDGRGLTARISQVQRRLQYLRVDEHLGTTIWPDRLNERDDDTGSGDARSGGPGEDRGAASAEGAIDLYRVSFRNAVRLSRGGQSAIADEADVWVRLRDRRLARNAVAPLVVGPLTTGGGSRESGSSTSAGRNRADDETLPIRFENKGAIEILTLIDAPQQLASDDLAARFRATETAAVVLRDEESGSTIRCGSLQWGFTSRQLAVRGVGGTLGVEFDSPNEATFRTGALDVDLAAGMAAFPGAGRLTLMPGVTGQSRATTIEWAERADVVLDTSSSAARASRNPLLRWMTASGEVVATTDSARVTGGSVRADFTSRLIDGEPRNDLNRVSVREKARAEIKDGDVDADVRGSRLDILFALGSGAEGERLVPTRASASGSAEAIVNGDRLSGDTIDAVIVTRDGERTRVQSIDASGDVRLLTREGVDLAASTLHASEQTGTMTLVGYPATVGLYEARDGRGVIATEAFARGFGITGESIRFDREPRILTVFGGGVLSYASLDEESGLYDNGSVRWQRSMRFDDRAGFAEFVGRVEARASTAAGSEYEMGGDRLELSLVSDLLDEQARRSLADGTRADAVVIAVLVEAAGGLLASAEARNYSAPRDDADRSLLTAARLSGDRIIAQRTAETLRVPGAGRLVLEDRRESGTARDDGVVLTDGRGTTVFDWSGGFDASLAERVATMSREVRMRHRHLGATSLTVVETELLTATLLDTDEHAGDRAYVLDSVDAEGAVLASHEGSQVVADRLSYSRGLSRVIASALPGNRVTFFDAETGRHLPAERVVLDLVTGRWRIEQAGQIVAPAVPPNR